MAKPTQKDEQPAPNAFRFSDATKKSLLNYFSDMPHEQEARRAIENMHFAEVIVFLNKYEDFYRDSERRSDRILAREAGRLAGMCSAEMHAFIERGKGNASTSIRPPQERGR